eukprot:g4553.t1
MFQLFLSSAYTFPYPGVSWIHPVAPFLGNLLLVICFLSSVALGVGFMTRVASIVNFLVFGYLFHLCQSNYNNHYVLMCHINFVGCFINWNTWGSVDAYFRKKKAKTKTLDCTIPYWHLLLMQLLFCVPYFFGGIAKMNHDWLFRSQPLIDWFSRKEGFFYRQWWFTWFISWSGMCYDLSISFLLMYPPTRYIMGFPGAIFFNFCNKLMFNIGVFPFAMIASLVLFLSPDWPHQLWEILINNSDSRAGNGAAKEEKIEPSDDEDKYKEKKQKTWHKWYVLIFVCSFLTFHSIYPLRHFFLFKGNPSWTEEGHIGAWHMKLRSKHGTVILEMEEMDGRITHLLPRFDPYVTSHQKSKVLSRPYVLLHYIGRLQTFFEEANRPLKAVRIQSCLSLNVNPHKELFVPTANILEYVGKYEMVTTTAIGKWMYPFEEAPLCDYQTSAQLAVSLETKSKAEYRLLYNEANIFKKYTSEDHEQRRKIIYHKDGNDNYQAAYTWKA